MHADHIPRLSELFYRVDRGRSREIGKGSRFTARFPGRRVVPARAASGATAA